ncbi:protein of unknown function [Taphrina deformans PYCC 5710]|uniref:Major facilitator superfamily (MFS) profile domain-containing protein n=1 Tax=Taphrina deformans (strain PYCC 5710 / ATCC 11124 / CBS 356.35 / IMI 108563 / JCM 9778 / NBRC 8474) TaxID=1097556 RepID=R4XGU3_TAPDE|nr:protein of unknown function [Taphrina deformans PYCC 5710]|eukprot:CCG83712.1 protein of unknown function [Taphrina deformans PYCC 5710]
MPWPASEDRLPVLFGLRSHERFVGGAIGFAIFTDLFLYGLIVPIVPYALTGRFGVRAEDVQGRTSVLLAIYAAGLVVCCPVVGWYADGSPSRRTPLLLGLVALLGSTLLFMLGRTYACLVVGRVTQGISAAVVWTVGLALLVDTVGKDRLGAAMGAVSIFMALGIALGPVVGGVVYDVGGYYAPFYIAIGFLLVDVLLRLAIIEKKTAELYRPDGTDGRRRRRQDTLPADGEQETKVVTTARTATQDRAGTRVASKLPPIVRLLRYPRLLTGCWTGFVAALLLSSFDAVLPLYLKDLWHFSALSSGLVYGSLVLPSFLFSPLVGWWVDSRGTKAICLLGLLLEVPLLTVLRFPDASSPRAGQVVEMCIILALNNFGLSCVLTSSMTEIALVVEQQEALRPGLFGRTGAFAQAYALFNMSFSAGTLVGPLVAGAIREQSGWGTMAWSLAVFAAVTIPPCLLYTGGTIRETHWIKARPKQEQGAVSSGIEADAAQQNDT